MLQPLLTDAQSMLLREEKQALTEIGLALGALEVPREDLSALQQATLQLDELFLLVVVGEFNAGKSALINALLGEKVLREGVTPTTAEVTLVKWSEEKSDVITSDNLRRVGFPLPLLREVNIVDTPGTNAVIRHHERLTNEFVPRSDLVLFVTSADRPMTESERQFLERIKAWGKKVVIALNKSDILQDDKELALVRDFVLQHAQQVLGLTPELFPVSARLAQQANAESDGAARERLREASHLEALARYIDITLDDQARVQLKLANPLGVAAHVIDKSQQTARAQSEDLQQDKDTSTAVEAVVTGYEQDLDNELNPRLAEIDNVLLRMQERGLDFFDNTIRLTNILGLARGDQVRAAFERQVLADVPDQVQERVDRLIDWLVDKDLHEWQQVMAYIQRRRAKYTEPIVGETTAPLDARRRVLIDSVGRGAQDIVESYDRDQEAHDLAVNVESAVAQVALLEVGAVSLGTLVTAAIASSTIDFTGLLAAGTLAVVGFFVIPYKRGRAKIQFREKTQILRDKLMESMSIQFKSEANSSISRMKDSVAPYTRFVRSERERVANAQIELEQLQLKISALKARVDHIPGVI